MKVFFPKQVDKGNMALTNKNMEKSFTAVDLFSGGGGLTVGLKKAGFKVIGAVEIEAVAYTTYKANHPDVKAFKQDVRFVKGQEILNLSPDCSVDLVAGCPPCQGFSSLTAKYRKDDPRNGLIKEMARLIREIQPKTVMMENAWRFRTKPATDSDSNQPPIPEQNGHLFRSKSAGHSGPNRPPL